MCRQRFKRYVEQTLNFIKKKKRIQVFKSKATGKNNGRNLFGRTRRKKTLIRLGEK